MTNLPPQLKQTADRVHAGRRKASVNVRRFLSWFGVQRRGYVVVKEIRSMLKRAKLVTEPDFETAPIEGRIRLLAVLTQASARKERPAQVAGPSTPETVQTEAPSEPVDPTPRLGTLDAAHAKPISVKRDAEVREALTLMIQHDFSQLPVMQNSREVDGLISWKSIAESSNVHNRECRFVRECMDTEVEILNHDAALWKAIKTIAEKDVVLVKNANKEIVGLVTTYDIAVKYHSLAEPFLLLGEIENNLRQLVTRTSYPLSVLESAKDPKDSERKIRGVSDLTLAEYIRLLQEPENWKSIGYNLSRKTFLADLDAIRKIRNEVMHFHPDPLTKEQLNSLRRVANMMRSLKLWSPNLKVENKADTKVETPISAETSVQVKTSSSSKKRKLRMAEIIGVGRCKPGDKLTIAGKPDSGAEVIDAKNVRLADGKIMTWNQYGERFTGHVAVNIYRHVLVNGISLESMR